MEVTIIKISGTILLWLCMVFFGLLPLRVRHFKSNKTLLALSNCFSGGLFIAIGLIHILPEAHENLEGRNEKPKEGEDAYVFPLSYVLCLGTFSFILLVDKVIFNNEDIAHNETHKHIDLNKSVFRHNESDNDKEENFKELVSKNYKVALKLSTTKQNIEAYDEQDDYDDIVEGHQEPAEQKIVKNNSFNSGTSNERKSAHSKFHNVFNENHDLEKQNVGHSQDKLVNHHSHAHNTSHQVHKGDHGHHGHQHRMVSKDDSGLTAYILLLAMGIHGLFAGIAFGVAKTSGETINMFIAMIAHKWSEALTVGISFVSAEIDIKKSTLMIVFLACITPLGVFIGYLISTTSDFVIGIAQAMSAGTFIYISCAEIIIEEFAISKHKFPKFVFYLLGIIFIGFVGTLEG